MIVELWLDPDGPMERSPFPLDVHCGPELGLGHIITDNPKKRVTR
jgi:hypothetical protein